MLKISNLKAMFCSKNKYRNRLNYLTVLLSTIFPFYALSQPLSGTYTIGSGGDFTTIQAAVNALNNQGVASPGVTFNVAADHTESVTSPITITEAGSASTPIVFQKSGTGNNPKVTRTDNGTLNTSFFGGLGDAIIKIDGTDYITFDKIDVETNQSGIEYGYFIFKPTATNGCKNLTIKNCNITMTNTTLYVVGIYVSNGPTLTNSHTGVNVSNSDGKHENITIIGNTISNVSTAIYAYSYNINYNDENLTIGQNGTPNNLSFGGGSYVSRGIFVENFKDVSVIYNSFSTNSTHPHGLYGCYLRNTIGSANISNNSFSINVNNSIHSHRFIHYESHQYNVTTVTINDNQFASTINNTSNNLYFISTNTRASTTIANNSNNGSFNTNNSPVTCIYVNNYSTFSGTENIYSNTFSNINTGTASFTGCRVFSSPQRNLLSYNNEFHDISNLYVGMWINSCAYGQIYDNKIYNSSSSYSNVTTLSCSNVSDSCKIYNNEIYDIIANASLLRGLYIAGKKITTYKNKIYNLTNNHSNCEMYGIEINDSECKVYNNYVYNLRTPSSASLNGLAGIKIDALSPTTNVARLYYNTVYLNASSTATNFGSSAIFISNNHVVELKNNIFVNTSTSNGSGKTVAIRLTGTSLTNYSNNSDRNIYYAGTPSSGKVIYYDGTNTDQTVMAFRIRVYPREANSWSENPPFVNTTSLPYDLHIQSTTPTNIESGGSQTSPAIGTDFDGDIRHGQSGYSGSGNAVDAGADEFDGLHTDLTQPLIIYTPLSHTASTNNRVLNSFATITDASGVNTTTYKPRLYYKKSTHNNTFVGNTSSDNGWKFVEATNNSSPFDFTIDYSKLYGGGVSVGDVIEYFVVAQDNYTIPNIGINNGYFNSAPSSVDLQLAQFPVTGTINSYTIYAALSGHKTVGSGGDYSTLTGNGGLFADINSKMLTGDLTVSIISDLTEPGTHALNQMLTENGNWTLTIRPNSATSRNIVGDFNGGLIRLNGADRVVFDGRFNGKGRYLIFKNDDNNNNNAVIWIYSENASNPATNITVRNCKIIGGGQQADFGIIVGGNVLYNYAEADNSNIKILYNKFEKSRIAIALYGENTYGQSNAEVNYNEIGSDIATDKIFEKGIKIYYQNNCQIKGNKIYGIISDEDIEVIGISVQYLLSNSNCVIDANKIYNLHNTNTDENIACAVGIDVYANNTNLNLQISNNVIYDLAYGGNWDPSIGAHGIRLSTGGGIKIYFNSINIATDPFASFGYGSALYIYYYPNDLSVVNNILSNDQTVGNRYSIYCSQANNSCFTTIDYNIYYSSQDIGYLVTSYPTLPGWQTATGQDANSISVVPNFTANDNLKPTVFNNHTGTSISGITQDFEGHTRHISSPRIGAYEGVHIQWLGVSSADWNTTTNWQNNTIPSSKDDISISNSATYMPQVTSNPSTPAECYSATIASGQTLTIEEGKALTVGGDLKNNGTLNIKSNSSGTGSLIHQTDGVNANIERYVSSAGWSNWDDSWHLISSPVASQALSAFITTGSGNDYDLYGWSESGDLWMNHKDGGFTGWNGSSNFVIGRGYLISYEQTQTGKTFIGSINVDDVPVSNLTFTNTSTHKGWHLLGNPFASPVKWNDGNWSLSNVAGNAKIWHSINKSYSDIAANGIIPQAQGFFVKVSSATNSLTIPAAARTHDNQAWYKSSDVPMLKLIARPTDGSSAQENILRMEPDATAGYDFYWDSQFLPGGAPYLYSLADGVKLSTNALPAIEESIEIPLGFEKNDRSNFSIELAENTLPAIVLLKDLKLGITHNLTQQPVYTFTSVEGDNANRFKLAFASVGIDPEQQNPVPYAWYANGMLYFRNVESGSLVEVYAAEGKLVKRERLQGNTLSLQVAPGVYMVRILGITQHIVQKVAIY